MCTLPLGSSARYTFPYLLSLIKFSSLKLFVYCCRDATENGVAEVGVLILGGLDLFSGGTMGFTTTLSMVFVLGGGLDPFSGGTMGFTTTFSKGGGGGGGSVATEKISESVRSKLMMCSFWFSGDFLGTAANNCTQSFNNLNLMNSIKPILYFVPWTAYLLPSNLDHGASYQGSHLVVLSDKTSYIKNQKQRERYIPQNN
jgi:hypothetical protein